MTTQDTPQEPEGADAAPADGEPAHAEPTPAEPTSAEPTRSASTRMQDAGARMQDAGTRMQDAGARAADDLRDRSKRLLGSLSARSRGEGWEKPTGELAKYRSRWRSALRYVLQRGFFGAVVRTNLTTTRAVHRRVRTIRGPFVLVSNHSSHIDAPMLARGLPWAQARFLSTGVAVDYFFNVWYKRLFVRLIFNAFPIDRGGSRKHSGTSRKLLRAGVPILVFPEGGRQKTGELADFKPGAAALAIGVGVPVVPAAIVGAHEAMPKGRSWPVPGRPPVRVVFGEPMISLEGESAVDFSARIRAAVKNLYDEHHDEVLGGAAPGEEESA
ncbi:lysophospholipid acyltransferase family protein [Brachybacterium sp. AOP43-C2-M15]|uniref:lysophospholipid acyltransferase family protein n=1 Tax=Brachybacterium sp. AOP43-C2-M15 TaxID=3457661 RepID=UPI0040335674